MLDIKERNKAIMLEGNYWTGRNTSGYVAFSSREKQKRKGNHRKQSKSWKFKFYDSLNQNLPRSNQKRLPADPEKEMPEAFIIAKKDDLF